MTGNKDPRKGLVRVTDISKPESPEPLTRLLYRGRNHIHAGDAGALKSAVMVSEALEMLKAGMKVAVIDYEGLWEEWEPRLFALARAQGVSEASLNASIFYSAPEVPIWEMAPVLRQDIEAIGGVDALLIDSLLFAIGEENPNDSQTAVRFKNALRDIGVKTTLINAHLNKKEKALFGSVQWRNFARIVRNFRKVEEGVKRTVIELTMTKTSGRKALPVRVEFIWGTGEHELIGVNYGDSPKSIGEAIVLVLSEANEGMSTDEVHVGVHALDISDVKPTYETVKGTLYRHRDKKWTQDSDGRWVLA